MRDYFSPVFLASTNRLCFLLMPVLLFTFGLPAAGKNQPAATDSVATVGGQTITRAELEEWSANQLRLLDRQRHQILENNLSLLIEEKLIEQEAESRKITVQELMQKEVEGQIPPVTEEDVQAWYQENQARIRGPKEQVLAQIRPYLKHQRGQALRNELLDGLRQRFKTSVHFEPLRLEIDLAEAPRKGPASAPITLVEYSDFQCPFCKRITPTLDQLKEAYGDQLQIAFQQFPLNSIHPQAQKAAEAALCAKNQGKFWQMHDALFAQQNNLSTGQLKKHADTLGLNRETFDRCLDQGETAETVRREMAGGQAIGVDQTPSFFVNGRPVDITGGGSPLDKISKIIDEELQRGSR